MLLRRSCLYFAHLNAGGYGYDSTDMAAIKYRLATLKCDWVIYITDAGQVIVTFVRLVEFASRAYSSRDQTLVTDASHKRC